MERKNRRRRKIERRKKSSAAITAKYNQTVIIDESDSHTGERDAQWKRNQPKTKEEEIQKSHSQTSKIFKIQSWIVPMIKTTIAHYPAIFVQYPNTYTHRQEMLLHQSNNNINRH